MMCWPKRQFKFFLNILWQSPNKHFGQLNTYQTFEKYFQIALQKGCTNLQVPIFPQPRQHQILVLSVWFSLVLNSFFLFHFVLLACLFFVFKMHWLGWFPIHLDLGCFQCCLCLKEHPSVSFAVPPVGWLSRVEQPAHEAIVCACSLKTVVISQIPGHFTSMKQELELCPRRFFLCLLFWTGMKEILCVFSWGRGHRPSPVQ